MRYHRKAESLSSEFCCSELDCAVEVCRRINAVAYPIATECRNRAYQRVAFVREADNLLEVRAPVEGIDGNRVLNQSLVGVEYYVYESQCGIPDSYDTTVAGCNARTQVEQ